MKSNQQKWLLIIIVVIALNAGIWFLGIDPARTAIDTVRKQTAAAVQKEAQLQQRLQVLGEIDVEALETEQIAQYVQIPDVGFLREILTELEAVAIDLDNDLLSMNIKAPALIDVFDSLTISMTLTGGYRSIYDYIKYLESHNRLLFIDNFSLNGAEDEMTVSIELVLFAENFDTYTPHEAPGRDNPFEVE